MNYTPSPYGNANPYGPGPEYYAPQPVRRPPDAKDQALAILSLVAAWLYARVMLTEEMPLAALGLTLLFYGIAFAFLRMRRIPVPKAAWWLPVSAAIFSFGYLLQSYPFVHWLAFQWAKFSCLWFLAAACGTTRSLPGETVLTDALKAVIVQPFCRFIALFPALFRSQTPGQSRKNVGWVLLGLVVAVIPTAIVIALLSFDEGFSAWLEKVFGNWTDRLVEELAYLVMAVPIGMYFFSAMTANGDGENGNLWNEESLRVRRQTMAFAPVAFGIAVMAPVLLVYVLFFAAQWEQYLYAFLFRLPSAFASYSAYARDGFFQLCAVAFINAALMLAAQLFVRKTEAGESTRAVKVLQGLYALATLALLATALAKMFLYVHYYGLTPLRVYPTWLMFAMVLAFLGVLVSLFWKRLRLVPLVFALGILFFGTLCFVDSHTLIARWNIRAYETRQLMKLDTEAMYELGDSAVAPLCEALDRGVFDKNKALEMEVQRLLCLRAYNHAEEEPHLLQMTPYRLHTDAVLAHYREQHASEYQRYVEEREREIREYEDWEPEDENDAP